MNLRSEIGEVEVIAAGTAIRELSRLEELHGAGRWRKLKGVAAVELPTVKWHGLKYTGTKLTASVAAS